MEDNEPNTTVRIQVKTLKILFNFEGAATAEYGGLAQLGEHLLCKQGVKGSIPLFSTTGVTPDSMSTVSKCRKQKVKSHQHKVGGKEKLGA